MKINYSREKKLRELEQKRRHQDKLNEKLAKRKLAEQAGEGAAPAAETAPTQTPPTDGGQAG